MDRRLVRIAATLALPLAVAVGVMEYQDRTDASAEKAVSAYETVAVVQEDAVPRELVVRAIPPPVEVMAVTWRSPAGTRHEGTVAVEVGLPAGTELAVWVDADGKITSPPRSVGENVVDSVAFALSIWFIVTAMDVGALWAIRTVRDRKRGDVWDAEWAEVEPDWSGRHRGPGLGKRAS